MEKNTITTTPTTTTKPKKKSMMVTSSSATKEKERWTNSTGERRERKRNERPTLGDITTINTDDHGAKMAVRNNRARRDERRRIPPPKNDNETMISPPFTLEQRIHDPTEEIIHDLKERIHDLNRQSGASNLVFAMDGEEESDDEWDSDDEDIVTFDSNGLEFDESDDYFDDPNETTDVPPPPTGNRRNGGDGSGGRTPGETSTPTSPTTLKEDFQGTRVFVQGLPVEATWKDLKDHFKRSLPTVDVVFASVSIDKQTGKSKQCGIVQFETSTMAQLAIREMRDHPMDGAKLYVRGDVQESSKREISRDRGVGGGDIDGKRREEYVTYRNDGKKISIATEWKRANEKDEEDGDGAAADSWYNLKDEELKEIEDLIQKRDAQRRQNNYKMSDKLRETLKEEFGVHLDDRLKLWWTDTKHGGVPGIVSEIKGEGRWGSIKPWKQIPTDPDSDALVDSNLVMRLLTKRDGARKRRAFKEADELLQQAYDVAGGRPGEGRGGLSLRIHDESRTWRIWTERPPPKKDGAMNGYEKLTAGEMCIKIVEENEPDKVDEMRALLAKFPGREWNIFKRLKGRYNVEE
jgi:RNA recognition motif-containing protein